jgi:ribosomal protein L37E
MLNLHLIQSYLHWRSESRKKYTELLTKDKHPYKKKRCSILNINKTKFYTTNNITRQQRCPDVAFIDRSKEYCSTAGYGLAVSHSLRVGVNMRQAQPV